MDICLRAASIAVRYMIVIIYAAVSLLDLTIRRLEKISLEIQRPGKRKGKRLGPGTRVYVEYVCTRSIILISNTTIQI